MVLTAELEPQRHHDAGNVSPAVDGVTARQRDQRSDRIALLLDRRAHLPPPRLVDPLEYRQGQILLALELVIQGAARVARLTRHLFEHQVAVAVAGEAPRGRLEQRASRAGAALSLGETSVTRRRLRRRAPHRRRNAYMHVCMVPCHSSEEDRQMFTTTGGSA